MSERGAKGFLAKFVSVTKMFLLSVLVLMVVGLCACSTGSHNGGQRVDSDDPPDTGYNRTTTTDTKDADSEKDYWDEKFLESDYEFYLTSWENEEWNLRRWLESGQQPEECRQAIIEWSDEVIMFDWSKVPDSYKSVHDSWVQRAYDLRNQV